MKQRLGVSILALFFFSGISRAQAPTAVVNGQVRDASGAAIAGATVEVFNDATHVRFSTETNDEGIYSVPNLPPGTYHIQVSKPGFKTVVHPDISLNVQDAKAIGFTLPVGAISDTVTVEGGAPMINTESATVSTVVDRQFAENLPLNGRSFQTLITLTPGVVLTSAGFQEQGQFSVNGQRADANYFSVDGVSGNFGMSAGASTLGQSAGGSIPGLTITGGTNSLVPVDAMQEFRIETSTYAPEFGRTPGAQISIVTRSGTNVFHGALFEYLRNDALDANDWFANQKGLSKAQERQNDFGGVLGGPIVKDKTFFFFSYEGLRLRLPQTGITTVPSVAARQAAPASIQPFLNAFPIPNGPDLGNDQAPFNATFSNQSTLNSYGLRIDHSFNSKLNVFGRYSYSASDLLQRGNAGFSSLSNPDYIHSATQFLTLGTAWAVRPFLTNDFRFNYSRNSSSDHQRLDTFGGAAVPADSSVFNTPFSSADSFFLFEVFAGQQLSWSLGKSADNIQRQLNILDNLSFQKNRHSLKLGVDYRRLSPIFAPRIYTQEALFFTVQSVVAGRPLANIIAGSQKGELFLHNFSAYVQDAWKTNPRLTLTYGLRWELNPAPSTGISMPLLAVTGFDNLSTLGVAPLGTPVWKTTYGNFAPRLSGAYQLRQSAGRETVLRGGFGVFYDLGTQQAGDAANFFTFPFGAEKLVFGSPNFPLTPTQAAPPVISATPPLTGIFSSDPNLKAPYTLEWNFAIEQALGAKQTVSASYIGALGRRLLQLELALNPNANFGEAELIHNTATSDYHSLQIQFQRRLSRGLQVLSSYTLAHSIDTASSGSQAASSDFLVRGLSPTAYRGPSDFDIRHSLSAAITYDIPTPEANVWGRAMIRGWSLQNVILARSAAPVNVFDSSFFTLFGEQAAVRPDLTPGLPLYLFGPKYPGGKALNNTPGAVVGGCPGGSQSIGPFCPPPTDANGNPLRQGNLGRNSLRGFGATQWDFAVHRDFPIRESLKLQFRAEMFNLLNHPNFASAVGDTSNVLFGQSTQMLGRSLGQGSGFGGLSALYQIGGPRSIQLALKLQF